MPRQPEARAFDSHRGEYTVRPGYPPYPPSYGVYPQGGQPRSARGRPSHAPPPAPPGHYPHRPSPVVQSARNPLRSQPHEHTQGRREAPRGSVHTSRPWVEDRPPSRGGSEESIRTRRIANGSQGGGGGGEGVGAGKAGPHDNLGIQRYSVGKTLGEGTFGKVKKGIHLITQMPVAIKILEKSKIVDLADVERVKREIHILTRINHPNVIRLYEVIDSPRFIYLIMEFAGGGELFDYIVKHGRVKELDACRFFHMILNGVDYCHKKAIIHRDLKPENLLLDASSGLKIVDFGLGNTAKDGRLLKTACGSPCYAAPEMIAGKRYVGSAADMWSLGVILYALVCGYLPFEDPNTSKLYQKIMKGRYEIPAFVPRGPRDLIQRMLTTDPRLRITAEGIRKHSWYCQVSVLTDPVGTLVADSERGGGSVKTQQPLSPTGDLGKNGDGVVDEGVLGEMKALGFDIELVKKSITESKHDFLAATYFLISAKRKQEGRARAGSLATSISPSGQSSSSSSITKIPSKPKLPSMPPTSYSASETSRAAHVIPPLKIAAPSSPLSKAAKPDTLKIPNSSLSSLDPPIRELPHPHKAMLPHPPLAPHPPSAPNEAPEEKKAGGGARFRRIIRQGEQVESEVSSHAEGSSPKALKPAELVVDSLSTSGGKVTWDAWKPGRPKHHPRNNHHSPGGTKPHQSQLSKGETLSNTISLTFSVPHQSRMSLNEIVAEILRVCARNHITCRVLDSVSNSADLEQSWAASPTYLQLNEMLKKKAAAVIECTCGGCVFHLKVILSPAGKASSSQDPGMALLQVVTKRVAGDQAEYNSLCRNFLPQLSFS